MLYFHFYVYDNEIVRKPSGYGLPKIFTVLTDFTEMKNVAFK